MKRLSYNSNTATFYANNLRFTFQQPGDIKMCFSRIVENMKAKVTILNQQSQEALRRIEMAESVLRSYAQAYYETEKFYNQKRQNGEADEGWFTSMETAKKLYDETKDRFAVSVQLRIDDEAKAAVYGDNNALAEMAPAREPEGAGGDN